MAMRFGLPPCAFVAACLAGMAAPVHAQAGPAARQFVDEVTIQTGDQAARFHVPVCPASFGLPGDYGTVVVARLAELARSAGIAVDPDGRCVPNLIVMVADDSEEAVSQLRRTRPDIFTGMEAIDVARAISAAGPVRAWQSSEAVRAEEGRLIDSRDSFLDQDVHLHHGAEASLLRTTTRRDLRLSVVMFSLEAIDGLTLMQIADHAAMRGLAPTRPAPIAAGRSILALFDAGLPARARPGGATEWDRAYLRALYRDGGASEGSLQRAALARLLERDLDGASSHGP
jgi:hypothetical protein